MLADAGFASVHIELHEESRALINQWTPEGNAGDCVVSAVISATKA